MRLNSDVDMLKKLYRDTYYRLQNECKKLET